MTTLPFVRVVCSELGGVKMGIAFCFHAAPHLLDQALVVAQRTFVGSNFRLVHVIDGALWVDYGNDLDLDDAVVEELVGRVAKEVGFSIIEPVPWILLRDYLPESMLPHLPQE